MQVRYPNEHITKLTTRFLGYYKKSNFYGSLFGLKSLPVARVGCELKNSERLPINIKILDLLAENRELSKIEIRTRFNHGIDIDKKLNDLIKGDLVYFRDGVYRLSYLGRMVYSIDADVWNRLRAQSWYRQLY